jgi:hypothetical protein
VPVAKLYRRCGVRPMTQPSVSRLRWKLINSGKVKTVVETVLSLAEARRAHELIQSGLTRGKIVLKAAWIGVFSGTKQPAAKRWSSKLFAMGERIYFLQQDFQESLGMRIGPQRWCPRCNQQRSQFGGKPEYS